MNTQKIVEAVGKMIVRNSKALPDDRAARQAFDGYVLAVASGRPAPDLSEGQLRALQGCDRREYDQLPKEVGAALGFTEGKTYRDALNLCEKLDTHRTKAEVLEPPKAGKMPKRKADRRQNDRRRSIGELARTLRKRLFRY
jgi:hypothetical protein